MDWSQVRGFNYQPSYGRTGFDLWTRFDARTIAVELGRGRRFFPGMNAIRFWLDWGAWNSADAGGRQRFVANFATVLKIAGDVGVQVMPVLFNRWHNPHLDYGGIYVDHFLPASWGGAWAGGEFAERCAEYVRAVVAPHAEDPRVLAWDLCNEPFSYGDLDNEQVRPLVEAELAWLRGIGEQVREAGARAPVTIGCHWRTPPAMIAPLCDLLSIHPYFTQGSDKARYEAHLDRDVAFAREIGKPLLSTETCWGDLDDAGRVEVIRYTLEQHVQRGIGFLVYLLHHSLIADAHRPEFGAVGTPMNLAFIEADGSLRPGHDVFNDY